MAESLVSFTWAKDTKGFYIPGQVDLNERKLIPLGQRIVRNGGTLQEYEPAKIESLLDSFLNVHTPADLLCFVGLTARLLGKAFIAKRRKRTLEHPTSFTRPPTKVRS